MTDASRTDQTPADPTEETAATGDLASLLVTARTGAQTWAETSLDDRIDAIEQVRHRILERADEIAQVVRRETGKPMEEAVLGEVLPNADLVDYWCDYIDEMLETEPVSLDMLSYPGKKGRTEQHPRGVIALITPWNYPVAIPLRTLIPALLCGNAVVFKPSEVTPECGGLVASLFEGLLPEGVLTLLQGDGEVGRSLLEGDIDSVVFTGSVPTGKAIAKSCAERLIPCSMELGGKDAAIVLDDCRLERTAQGIVWGAFTNAGQNCASVERVFVTKEIADKFIERVAEITKSLRQGIDTGAMTTAQQKQKAAAQLSDAIEAGATVVAGGMPDPEGLMFNPTVLRIDASAPEPSVLTEETFGPLLPIVVVDDEKEAIARTNACRYALTSSIWTKDTEYAERISRQLHSGVVTINNHGFTAALPAAPWTGKGDTGYGVTNSRHTLHALTRPRFVLVDRSRDDRELWWYPYNSVLRTIALSMARFKGGSESLFERVGALTTVVRSLPKRFSDRQ